MRQFKTLTLRSSATLALLSALSFSAQAQVSVTEDTSDQIVTSTAGEDGTPSDVTVDAGATVTIDSERAGIILDSDNNLDLAGTVEADNIDNVTGVELQGGADRSYTQSGSILLLEDFVAEDTDDDPFPDGPFAEGEGRTGILISGASPFQGNIELEASSIVSVEGNDSFGINLANTPMMTDGLTGNLLTAGTVNVRGDRSTGINLASNIVGDVTNEGAVFAFGEDAQGIVVSGDIDGSFESNNAISATSFRSAILGEIGFAAPARGAFTGDLSDTGRDDLSAEDLLQAGSALNISGNVSGGIFLSQRFEALVDADGAFIDAAGNPIEDGGDPVFTLVSTSSITQFGSAPAVIIDGGGNPIAVGVVAEITDPTDENFDENLQFGFINQGAITSSGIFDDVNSTAVSVANVTFDGGISNSGTLTAQSFRAPNPTDLADGGDGIARVLVLGNQAIADEINNSGIIAASVSEAVDEVFFDRANIIPPRDLLAVGVDIEAGASVTDLVNSGAISAVLVGRDGTAVAIRDASGTIRTLTNTGVISTSAQSSDSLELEETEFNLIAIDFSAATQSVEITQSQNPNATISPLIAGDILLGSGDDILDVSAGGISGDIDFGGGNDTLTLSGNSIISGAITNSDNLALSVTDGSTLALQSGDPLQVSNALIDSTSVFQPVIDGATGEASALISTGNITFEEGATISPILNSIIGTDTLTYTIASADTLTIGDLDSLSTGASSFLFTSDLELADPNTLVVTLDLRDPGASLADGGLGLDAVQLAAFGSVVNGQLENGAIIESLAATPALGNAFSNITEASEFQSAINQVLPEFSGAGKQFVLANVDGAVGAVGSHLDTARRSPERSGGAWLQEFFYFADRSLAGQSEQFRGEGFGFSTGIDTAFGPFHAVGVNASFASTEIEDVVGVDEPLNIRTYQAGAYAGLQKGGFNFDVYGGAGISDFDQTRSVVLDGFLGSAQGEWQGFHVNGALRAGYDIAISDKFWARPSVSVDYLFLDEEGFDETGSDGVRLSVEDRSSDTAAASAILNIGAAFQGKRTWLRPSIRVGYRNEFISDPVETAFRFQGLSDTDGNVFDSELARLRSFAFPDEGILLGFTVAAGSEYSAIGFDFDSDIRDGFIRHTGRIVVRLLF